MSVDKIFEALSSAPRRRILAYLSKTDMTAGRDRAAVLRNDVTAGYLKALVGAGERRSRMAREARPERALWARRRRTHQCACALPGRGVPRLASFPEGQRRGRHAQKSAQGRTIAGNACAHSTMTMSGGRCKLPMRSLCSRTA